MHMEKYTQPYTFRYIYTRYTSACTQGRAKFHPRVLRTPSELTKLALSLSLWYIYIYIYIYIATCSDASAAAAAGERARDGRERGRKEGGGFSGGARCSDAGRRREESRVVGDDAKEGRGGFYSEPGERTSERERARASAIYIRRYTRGGGEGDRHCAEGVKEREGVPPYIYAQRWWGQERVRRRRGGGARTPNGTAAYTYIQLLVCIYIYTYERARERKRVHPTIREAR